MKPAFKRRIKQTVLVIAAGGVFVAGLISVFGDGPESVSVVTNPSESQPGIVGPDSSNVSDYVRTKTELLRRRALDDPGDVWAAVISFDSYRSSGEVEDFLRSHRADATAVFVRVPVPGQEQVKIEMGDSSLSAAVKSWGTTAHESFLREARELEKLIPTVDDPAFEAVYASDARSYRDAAAYLQGDDFKIVYAVIVKAPLRILERISREDSIALVDTPESRQARGGDDVEFAGLLPEDSAKSS